MRAKYLVATAGRPEPLTSLSPVCPRSEVRAKRHTGERDVKRRLTLSDVRGARNERSGGRQYKEERCGAGEGRDSHEIWSGSIEHGKAPCHASSPSIRSVPHPQAPSSSSSLIYKRRGPRHYAQGLNSLSSILDPYPYIRVATTRTGRPSSTYPSLAHYRSSVRYRYVLVPLSSYHVPTTSVNVSVPLLYSPSLLFVLSGWTMEVEVLYYLLILIVLLIITDAGGGGG